MRRLALALVPVLAAAAVVASPQKRVSQQTPADFAGTLTAAQTAWSQGKYGACLESLKQATGLVMVKRVEVVLAALPKAPEGFEKVEDKRNQAQQNQMIAGMAAMVGSIIEQKYRGPHNIDVTVTANSPMVSMLSMGLSNPALLEQGAELIEYGPHKAILKPIRGGNSRELTIIIDGKHLIQVQWGSSDEDALFAMWNQAAVDRVAATLDE